MTLHTKNSSKVSEKPQNTSGLDEPTKSIYGRDHAEYDFIEMHFLKFSDSDLTEVWRIVERQPFTLGPTLGYVKWFGKWRQYSFYPEPNTIFEHNCLRNIASFCEVMTALHRDALKKKKVGT